MKDAKLIFEYHDERAANLLREYVSNLDRLLAVYESVALLDGPSGEVLQAIRNVEFRRLPSSNIIIVSQ